MRDSLFKKWLTEQGFFTKGKEFTHLLMDGGKLDVPTDRIYDFYIEYIKGLDRGETYFICEYPPKGVRKFYCDLDIELTERITAEEMSGYFYMVYLLVTEYFGTGFAFTICSSPEKELENGKIKTGIHLVWEDLYLTEENSILLSKKIIERLNETNEMFGRDLKWEEIVDQAVYKTGLRMLGSSKMNKKSDGKKQIWIVEDRKYEPCRHIDSDGNYDENYLDNDYFKYLRDCSIQNHSDYKAYDPVKRLQEEPTNEVKEETEQIRAIRKFIKKWDLPKGWDTTIKSVTKSGGHYIVNSQSQFCLNINDDHKRQTVYFQIYQSGIVQRCLCKCKGKGRAIECSRFRSNKFALSEELFELLFPKKKQRRSEKIKIELGENIFPTNHSLNIKELNKYIIMSENTIKYMEKKYT